ncbi:MAG: hypothetical protein JXA21_20940 [Anaerolineae bacterium]|nr:hypothetical protein [Anaerolineae bacterium]
MNQQQVAKDMRLCGQCHKPCGRGAHTCHFCGEPICEECLVVYEIRSKTHDGLIYHHKSCDEKSSAKDFRV